ncbi:Branched-chain-amino-acid aminotransferase, cytosolic [Fusarium oxysporum f. sp. albedinis]|nr:Branched-chain-amino-acid aminotransferase, cytosolic [Fusarium oxysporum f. sp. albedinis]
MLRKALQVADHSWSHWDVLNSRTSTPDINQPLLRNALVSNWQPLWSQRPSRRPFLPLPYYTSFPVVLRLLAQNMANNTHSNGSVTKVNGDKISGTEFTTTHLLGSRSALSATASICSRGSYADYYPTRVRSYLERFNNRLDLLCSLIWSGMYVYLYKQVVRRELLGTYDYGLLMAAG